MGFIEKVDSEESNIFGEIETPVALHHVQGSAAVDLAHLQSGH